MYNQGKSWAELTVTERANAVSKETDNVVPDGSGGYNLLPVFLCSGEGVGPDMRGNTPPYTYFAGGATAEAKMAKFRDPESNRLVADNCVYASKYITPSLGRYVSTGLVGKQVAPKFSVGVARFPVVRLDSTGGPDDTPQDVLRNYGGIVEVVSSGEPLIDYLPGPPGGVEKRALVRYADIELILEDRRVTHFHVDVRFPPMARALETGTVRVNGWIDGNDENTRTLRVALCTMALLANEDRWFTFHVPSVFQDLPLEEITGSSWGMALLSSALGITLHNVTTGGVGWSVEGLPLVYPSGRYREKGIIAHGLTSVSPVFVSDEETRANAGLRTTMPHEVDGVTTYVDTLAYFDMDLVMFEDLEIRPYMYVFVSIAGFCLSLAAINRGIENAPRGAEEEAEVAEHRERIEQQLQEFGQHALDFEYMDKTTRDRLNNIENNQGSGAFDEALAAEVERRKAAPVEVEVPQFDANNKKLLQPGGKGMVESMETLTFPLFDFQFLSGPEVVYYLFKRTSPVARNSEPLTLQPPPDHVSKLARWNTLAGVNDENVVKDWLNKGNHVALRKAFKRAYVNRHVDLEMSNPTVRATMKYTLSGGKRRKGLNKPSFARVMANRDTAPRPTRVLPTPSTSGKQRAPRPAPPVQKRPPPPIAPKPTMPPVQPTVTPPPPQAPAFADEFAGPERSSVLSYNRRAPYARPPAPSGGGRSTYNTARDQSRR